MSIFRQVRRYLWRRLLRSKRQERAEIFKTMEQWCIMPRSWRFVVVSPPGLWHYIMERRTIPRIVARRPTAFSACADALLMEVGYRMTEGNGNADERG